ncbi:MAG TPA: tRNA (adenosine(37)-N6)-dimethylallyltransferase MiaA [Bacillus sp. (in: firmicutes)]|uniref:tRNA (adenosine(37)-N6)-dimethylallyltransferase MiaA n=1 Tax=Bacillus litorisediminis TaxID=2922713 RepID=UPI001FACC350|nr:tRNA (adenosine(37)-N6)-dimethylallyltransferase MiaA [Bacillus litorisediminis]HWO78044.1 tRNA (adenosine(37)-N6)-dimethylallyltransferase MiaA [Bacillus sp. (in: firmicutes)]
MDKRQKVAVIIGPTAVGKTKVSIELAKRWNGEIISGDSMQIYRGLDIGTAKVTEEEMDGVPHHLIDIRDPEDSFTVADFQALVREKITEIEKRGKLPFIVGGTGLYIQSVLFDYQFQEESSTETREKLYAQYEKEGIAPLFQKLQEVDPKSADVIHPNNIRRVIRALEVYLDTGLAFSEWKESQTNQLLYQAAIIGLTMERDLLYDRINQRVDAMMEAGLLDEVKKLYDQGIRGTQSVQGIGYKELYEYFDGTADLEHAVEKLKKNSRNYAKRQLTWFRNQLDVKWFDMTDISAIEKKIEEISQYLAGKLKLGANT